MSYPYFISTGREKFTLNSFGGLIKMQATETRKQLNLHEPEAALAWIDAFNARCRAEKKANVPAAGTTPAVLQVTDQIFPLRCGKSYEGQIACFTDKSGNNSFQ